MKIPEFMFHLGEKTPQSKRLLEDSWKGSIQSSWFFLVAAGQSNLHLAEVQTENLVKLHEDFVRQKKRPAESYCLMNWNYSKFLAGPVFGAILCSSAATEAFLRIVARAYLEKDVPKRQRARGPSNEVMKRLAKSEDMPVCAAPPIQARIDWIYREVVKNVCPDDLREELKHLNEFRNSCMHAEPVLRLESGGDETTKKKRGKSLPITRAALREYPILWISSRPLGLKHALRAAEVHDRIVATFGENADFGFIWKAIQRDYETLDLIGFHVTAIAESLAALWEKINDKLLDTPMDDVKQFFGEHYRKANLRVVEQRDDSQNA
ncbi:MAG: hypothetical protein ABSH28_09715 [Acidobacteriota bacterium]|jgi:hypothetical protein